MQMTLTITAESPAEMVTVLKALQLSGVEAPVQLSAGGLPSMASAMAAVMERQEPKAERDPDANYSAPTPKRGRPFGSRNVSSAPKLPEQKTELEAPAAKLSVVPKAKEQAKEPEKEITILDVRKALTEFLQANSETAAAALLAKHGHTDRLSKLEPQYFAAVYRAATTPITSDLDDDIADVAR